MHSGPPRVINLASAPGAGEAWGRPAWVVMLWLVVELAVVSNPLQVSSRLRAWALTAFGAQIGEGVILRPRLRVKFPWKLQIGDRTWIGESVWIHNQDIVTLGDDVVISQGCFLTTGSHAFRDDMALVTRPITVQDGAWVTSRCVVLAGSTICTSAVVLPNTVVRGEVPAGVLYSGVPGATLGERFR